LLLEISLVSILIVWVNWNWSDLCSCQWCKSSHFFNCVIGLVGIGDLWNPFGQELELSFGQCCLISGFITNWSEINENVVLSWDDILSTELTLEDLGHLEWVVGLRSEVEIKIFTSGLHNNNHIIIESKTLSDQVDITSRSFSGTSWDFG